MVVLERLTWPSGHCWPTYEPMERYRRGFYMQIVTGRQAEQGPQRRGGLFGGAGLEGFTALGWWIRSRRHHAATRRIHDTGTPGAGGYLGLLQQQLQIENQEENIARLRENLLRLEDTDRELLQTIPASQDILPTQQLQVAQARQALFIAQNNLITLSSQYEQQLDTFKRLLGMPPYLCVEIRDPLLERFKLITPPLKARRVELSNLRDAIGQTNTRILNLSSSKRDPKSGTMVRSIASGTELTSELQKLKNDIGPMTQVRQQITSSDISAIMQDIANLRAAIPDRRRQLARLRDIADREKGTVCRLLPLPQFDLSLLKDDDLQALPDKLVSELDKLAKNFASYEKRIQELEQRLNDNIAALSAKTRHRRATRQRMIKSTQRRRVIQEIEQRSVAGQPRLDCVHVGRFAGAPIGSGSRSHGNGVAGEVDIEPRDAVRSRGVLGRTG